MGEAKAECEAKCRDAIVTFDALSEDFRKVVASRKAV
jgi:hypothetical protein